jgi:hypothetical protein
MADPLTALTPTSPHIPHVLPQVLRYEPGQHYGVHHDYGADDLKLACGPRILTFFLYLSGMYSTYC